MQNLNENTHTYKTLLRMIKQDPSKWRNISCCWFSKFNIAKISILPKLIYWLHTIAIKILMGFFFRTWQSDFKIDLQEYTGGSSEDHLEKAAVVVVEAAFPCEIPTFIIATIIKAQKIIQYMVKLAFETCMNGRLFNK